MTGKLEVLVRDAIVDCMHIAPWLSWHESDYPNDESNVWLTATVLTTTGRQYRVLLHYNSSSAWTTISVSGVASFVVSEPYLVSAFRGLRENIDLTL